MEGLDAGVFDCMCKAQGTGSKASRDYQCTAQDSWNQGPEGQAFQETGESARYSCLSLSVSFRDCHLLSPAFFSVFGP